MSAVRLSYSRASVDELLRSPRTSAHPGLVFDRYLEIWESDLATRHRVKELRLPLDAFVRWFKERGEQREAQALLADYHGRIAAAAEVWNADSADYRVVWRLSSGLGSQHPTENGFSFDSLIGVPVLPGSAVKGLCRSAAVMLGEDRQRIEALLGPEQDGAHACGELICYDALPIRWPRLCVDIANCHHPDYYAALHAPDRWSAQAVRRGPSETEAPVPVYFLSVDQGAEFRFRIGSRKKDPASVQTGLSWLNEGLTLLGLGAKTAVGYGAMERVTADEVGDTGGGAGGGGTRGAGAATPAAVTWTSAALQWNKGKQELTARHGRESAFSVAGTGGALLDALPEPMRNKLLKGKSAAANVHVLPAGGGKWRIGSVS